MSQRLAPGLSGQPGPESGAPRPAGSGRLRAAGSGQPRPQWAERFERGDPRVKRWAVRLALWAGRRVARILLWPVTLYFLAVSPGDRRVSREYLRRALGREARWTDLFRHFHAFASTMLDRVYLLNGQYGELDTELHGESIVQGILRRGRGCLLLGAHFGSFEIVRFAGRHAGVPPVSLVMYEDNARALREALDAINPEYAMQVIPLGRIDSMLEVERALDAGGFVGLLADRTIQGEGTVACPFLGGTARFPRGPFRIAAMLRRPVVLMLGVYGGGRRYDVHFELIADLSGVERGQRDRAVDEALRRYVARLEHHCRRSPYNWFNFYEYWG
jgi:predicted LPLAT superfamily acyltransferase